MARKKGDRRKGTAVSVDWLTVLIYVVLMAMGWMSVCGASYDFDQAGNVFSLSTRSGMQLVWIGTSLILAGVILLTDDNLFETLSYVIYLGFVALLLVTPFLAKDIKGSLSWIKIGSFSIQPAEFAKFATALCVSKVVSTHGFDVGKWRDFLICSLVILLPMALVVMQKETGSALVYSSFFLMMYREGMPGSLLFCAVSAVVYFVVGIRFADEPLWGIPGVSLGEAAALALVECFTLGMLRVYTALRSELWRLSAVSFGAMGVSVVFAKYIVPCDISWVFWTVCLSTVVYLVYLSLRDRAARYFYIVVFAAGSLAFYYSANFVMENVLQEHQRTRVQVLLGLKDDPRGAGYNVIQAKIAIGSGGLEGKGFLNGTQTKLKYVPEQDTDFIFCTVGEEEGFLGCFVVLTLFLVLILRLIYLAERQSFAFGRMFGYCVMGVFLFHVFVNVGMVLGLTPVIGIPLPFFSYGGSSLWSFTILLFIFLRIDAGRKRT